MQKLITKPPVKKIKKENLLTQQSKRLHTVTKEQWDFAHLGLPADAELPKSGLVDLSEYDLLHPDEHLLKLMMDPNNFGWTCSKIFNTQDNENGLELLPIQCAILKELWDRPFPMLIGSRGLGKSFLLGLYAVLRALFIQGRKIVITGAGFRQAKTVFNYAELLWHNSPVLRDLCGATQDKTQGPHHDTDVWWMQIGESIIKALPMGDGSKIRGQRAHDIISDEFASIKQQVFEEVVSGFGVVNLDPINQVKHFQRMEYLADIKQTSINEDLTEALEEALDDTDGMRGNQIIISGTASFAFNHFCSYWKKHKSIIMSGGDKKKLKEVGIESDIDHKKYSILRLPVHLLPRGFMDEEYLKRSQASMSIGIFENEFGAVFAADSSGFFKRSIIDHAVPTKRNPIILSNGDILEGFSSLLYGDPSKRYIISVDTASERDNFAICILETYEDHARVVYCWTTNRASHVELRKIGLTEEKDFYAFCAKKVRSLMKVFNIYHICMDSQGGGRTIAELLHNDKYIDTGESAIWEISEGHKLWDGKKRVTDDEPGLHILEMCDFVDNRWLSDANHGMKHDLEQRRLVFPYFDDIEMLLASSDDEEQARLFDTAEQLVAEIEEMKNELTTILHDNTNSNREKWFIPKIRTESGIGRLYDDRYAALLMANSAARRFRNSLVKAPTQTTPGGFMSMFREKQSMEFNPKNMYTSAPSWVVDKLKDFSEYGGFVKRQ